MYCSRVTYTEELTNQRRPSGAKNLAKEEASYTKSFFDFLLIDFI